LILPGDLSSRSMRPTLLPPLDRQATLSPFNGFAMLSSKRSALLNSLEAIRLQEGLSRLFGLATTNVARCSRAVGQPRFRG
jgi:hypothetical protein